MIWIDEEAEYEKQNENLPDSGCFHSDVCNRIGCDTNPVDVIMTQADKPPKVCKGCGKKHLMITGHNEYTCYSCGQVNTVKRSKQSEIDS